MNNESPLLISVGDVVQATCGGPLLTVSVLHGEKNATCFWFDKTDNFRQEPFPIAALHIPELDYPDNESGDEEVK
jgi:uncharacterized protein YodC (DUF2158 family)